MIRYWSVLMLALLVTMGSASAVLAQNPNNSNDPAYWCGDDYGVKYEPIDTPYIVPSPPDGLTWYLLVIKAGSGESENHTWANPQVGVGYSHPSGKDNSHVILCAGETTTPSTTSSTTTSTPSSTTVPPSSTTTTSSTTTVPPTTTTTSGTSTTTTSPATTTTTSPPTTTTTEPPTTTTTSSVIDTTTTSTTLSPTSTTTTEPVTTTTLCAEGLEYNEEEGECGLPFTGPFALLPIAVIATVVLLTGMGLVYLGERGRSQASV